MMSNPVERLTAEWRLAPAAALSDPSDALNAAPRKNRPFQQGQSRSIPAFGGTLLLRPYRESNNENRRGSAWIPWTMGFAPNLRTEIRVYARFILDNYPNAKIGLLLISASSFKEAGDPTRSDDEGMPRWVAFMDRYYPAATGTASLRPTATVRPSCWSRCCSNAGTICRAKISCGRPQT
jgi:hypothetical protein